MELQALSATGLLLVCPFPSTLTHWVMSSSFMALCIFCQPFPSSSLAQLFLSMPDSAFLTSPNVLY